MHALAKFELVINLMTAKAVGLSVSPMRLSRATDLRHVKYVTPFVGERTT